MTSVGIVREWHEEDGWGVISCSDTPGGCWVHYSRLAIPQPRYLFAGQDVEFEWSEVCQSGFKFSADRAWLLGQQPSEFPPVHRAESGAYRSTLTAQSDDSPERDAPGF